MPYLKRSLVLLAVLVTLACAQDATDTETGKRETIETRIGKLTFENSFEHGIPTAETAERIFDQIDFQRASQAYIWAIPIVSMYEWMNTHDQYGGERGQIVYHESYQSKLGGLTYNTSTPYARKRSATGVGPGTSTSIEAPEFGACGR